MIKKFEYYKNYPFSPPPIKKDIFKPYKKNNVIYGLQSQKFNNKNNKFKLEQNVLCVDQNNENINNQSGHVVDFIMSYKSIEYKEKVYIYLIYFNNKVTDKPPENGIPHGYSWWIPEFNLQKI